MLSGTADHHHAALAVEEVAAGVQETLVEAFGQLADGGGLGFDDRPGQVLDPDPVRLPP